MSIIYKITILNWGEYNPKHKKSFKKLMIPNNFAQDAKLNAMPVTHRWMWLVLLLTCSDYSNDTVELSERQVRAMLESSKSIDSVLDRLQSFQLLRYEKYALSKENRKEDKRIEKKEYNRCGGENVETKEPEKLVPKLVSTPARKSSPRGCINDFLICNISEELLKNVTSSLQNAWLSAYPNPEWICHEIRKANAWCEANPKKRPKDFGRFMNTWLNNGFEQYRKGIATNKGSFVQRNNDELRKHFEREENENC